MRWIKQTFNIVRYCLDRFEYVISKIVFLIFEVFLVYIYENIISLLFAIIVTIIEILLIIPLFVLLFFPVGIAELHRFILEYRIPTTKKHPLDKINK